MGSQSEAKTRCILTSVKPVYFDVLAAASLVFTSLVFAPISTFAITSVTGEAREFFTGARQQAMGGVTITTVNDETALLANPAALGKLRDSFGTILDPELEVNANNQTYYTERLGTNPARLSEAATWTSAHKGEYFHAKTQLFPSFVLRNFGIGVYVRDQIDAATDDLGTSMDTHYLSDQAIALGYNFRFWDGRIKLGFTGKYVMRVEVDKIIDPTGDTTLATHASAGNGISTDVGLILTAPWKMLPTLSVVAHDLGGTKYSQTAGARMATATQPADVAQDIDVGLAIFPQGDRGKSRSVLALEYHKMTAASADEDKTKYYHLGYEYNYGDLLFLRAGFQKYWTAGFEFASERTQFQVSTYGEEVGTSAAPVEDRRILVKFSFRF